MFDGIGQDLVAMCVNDIVVQGAEPLFFLDYYATGKLDVDAAARGDRRHRARLQGIRLRPDRRRDRGDAGPLRQGRFRPGRIFRRRGGARPCPARTAEMRAGDVLIGVASSGVHSNGYSLVRKVVEKSGLGLGRAMRRSRRARRLGEALLTPTRLYVKSALEAMRSGGVKGFAHITGGGITENLPRACPKGWMPKSIWTAGRRRRCSAGWRRPAGIAAAEMLRTFNCGIGLVAVVAEKSAGHVIDAFQECGDKAMRIGQLVRGDGEAKVVYRGTLKL